MGGAVSVQRLTVGPPPATPRTRAETVYGLAGFLELEHQWRDLQQAFGSQNPFLAWEWVSEWVVHFCGDQLVTVVIRDSDRALAIAPFYRRQYTLLPGLRARCLQLFGPREIQHIFELREIPVRPGAEMACLRLIMKELQSLECDWIELSAYGRGVVDLQTVLAEIPALRPVDDGRDEVPVMRLRSSWEHQREGLKRNVKESIRHSYNALKREAIAWTFSVESLPTRAEASTRTFLDLYTQRSRVAHRVQHANHFASASTRAFLVEVARRMMGAGLLEFCTVRVDERVAASRMCMTVNGTLYLYYSGMDPAFWKYGPTTLLVTERIKRAIQEGRALVNFSPGIDPSKSRWGVTTHPLARCLAVRRHTRSSLLLALVRLRRSQQLRSLFYRYRRFRSAPPGSRDAAPSGVRSPRTESTV